MTNTRGDLEKEEGFLEGPLSLLWFPFVKATGRLMGRVNL